MTPLDRRSLINRISSVLAALPHTETLPEPRTETRLASAVVVPIGAGADRSPCLIFNKRSTQVRQPGDLCFPGGSPEPKIDPLLAVLLHLPGSPLRRWPHFRQWENGRRPQRRQLSLMLAAGLRESYEEMRLNPLSVRFLGALPAQRLKLFQRVVHPMVGWVEKPQRFRTNWEVDRIVRIRVADLLDPARYRRYRIAYAASVSRQVGRRHGEFPAFRHNGRRGVEMLWGVTYRITAAFLNLVFDFAPPALSDLDRVDGFLDESYYGAAGPGSPP